MHGHALPLEKKPNRAGLAEPPGSTAAAAKVSAAFNWRRGDVSGCGLFIIVS